MESSISSLNARRRSLLKSLGAAAAASALSPLRASGLPAQSTSAASDSIPGVVVKAIYLNQVGYLPHQAKVASVVMQEPGAGGVDSVGKQPFSVWSHDGARVVFRGVLSEAKRDAASGDLVALADLSGFNVPGSYRVEAAGTSGDLFLIKPGVYRRALRVTMRGFSGQRCGCKVDLGHGYKHALCHGDGEFGLTSGRSGKVRNAGGWHDAGDYGRYVVNSGISTGTLLWAWELYPDALRSLHLAIPESRRALPDYLAEVKWNLNWMLEMQDSGGGVWHKQTSEHFCAFIMPEKDDLVSEIIGTGSAPYKSTCATADLAAVMAIAARCYRPYQPKFARRCLAAARRAYAWSVANPNVVFKNPDTIKTGEYGDRHCDDEILWAAAELFRTTQEDEFEAAVLRAVEPMLPTLKLEPPSWGNVGPMGLWTYALARPEGSHAEAIRTATQSAAALLLERVSANGYGNTLVEREYHWGSNSTAGNQSLLLLMAHHFESNQAAVDAAMGNLHYLLGRNCHGVSWVTQLGVRPFMHPHHRPSVADKLVDPWPGLLSGGPNAHGGDAVADKLPKAPPMKMWLDDDRAYSMNEIAINWNAPLVFVLAAANSKRLAAASA